MSKESRWQIRVRDQEEAEEESEEKRMVGLWGSICSLSPPSSPPSSHNGVQRPLLWTNSLPRKNRRQPGEWNFYEKTESCYDLTTLDFGYRQKTNNQLSAKSQSGSALGEDPREEDRNRKRNSLVRTQSGLIVPPRRRRRGSQGKEARRVNGTNTERNWGAVEIVDKRGENPWHSQNGKKTMVCGELVRSQSGLLVPPRGRRMARQEMVSNTTMEANKRNMVGSSTSLRQDRQQTMEEQDLMRREERKEFNTLVEINRRMEEDRKMLNSNNKLSEAGRRDTPKRIAPSPPLNPTTTPTPTSGGKTPPAPPPRKKSLQAATYSKVLAKSAAANISNNVTRSDSEQAPTKDNVDAFWKLINSNMALNYFMTDGVDEASKILHEGNNEDGFNNDDVLLRRTESSDSDSPPPLRSEIWRTPRESWLTSPGSQKTLIPTSGDHPEVWKTPRQSWMTTSDGYIDCCEEFRDCWRKEEKEKGMDEEKEGKYARVEKNAQVGIGTQQGWNNLGLNFREKEERDRENCFWQICLLNATKSAS